MTRSRLARPLLAVTLLLALAGCIVAPDGYYGGYYGSPAYVAPAPVIIAPAYRGWGGGGWGRGGEWHRGWR